ncbi:hypothetical protein AVEN_77160-1 [Araneus ventricosus]|uniref:F-box domain-containing protein n=1 Tax=Araneus ventricosus TaxID=182803 RepID=A0A4Y2IEJ1_ARAVE|nr:hypothetical protein AVEN_77160-1 [Araneus ventricosus]
MTLYSLYRICLQKIAYLLRINYWDSWPENPFSCLPTTVVEELVGFVTYRRRLTNEIELIDTLRPLLTSGQIKHLDVFHWNSKTMHDYIMILLTEEFCKNLVTISIPYYPDNDFKIKSIILTCSNLVQVHLPVFIELDIFESCPHLRSLRFHSWREATIRYFCSEIIEFPNTIRNLEVFSVSDNGLIDPFISCDMKNKIISRLLANCSKLISVGFCDSTDAFQHIDGTDDNPSCPLQLRRCVWGLGIGNVLAEFPLFKRPRLSTFESEFATSIQKAVSSCPFVEELVIFPFNRASLQHLESLENLSLLKIDFQVYHGDYVPDFISLLNKIGPRLRHLAVRGNRPIAIDTVCSICPGVISLKISGTLTVSDPSKIGSILYPLKQLSLDSLDEISLEFILSNCTNVAQLVIGKANCFDDSISSKIMERGAFTKLKVVSVETCRFTEKGMLTFLESVPSLKKINISVVTSFLHTRPNTIIQAWITKTGKHVEVEDDLRKKEFFAWKLNRCIF